MGEFSKTILTSESGTGSVNLPGTPISHVANARIVEGVGQLAVEAMGAISCRLMVTGGVLDGKVLVAWEIAG